MKLLPTLLFLSIITAWAGQDSTLAPPPLPDTVASDTVVAPERQWKQALLMLPFESDYDSASTKLWSDMTTALLAESHGPVIAVGLEDFPTCQDVDCLVQQARAQGARGLFTGRLKTLPDSLDVRMRIYWLQGKRTANSEARHRIPLDLRGQFAAHWPLQLVAEATGQPIAKAEVGRSWIRIETDPEGATIAFDENIPACKSPCVVPHEGTAPLDVQAHWRVDELLWGARASVKPLPGDTVPLFLKLRRLSTIAEIRSEPNETEVFSAAPLDARSKPLGKTPFLVYDRDPGTLQFRLWRPGYRDTVVNLRIDPTEKTVIAPTLVPITDPQELARQNSLVRERNKRKLGFTLLGSSLGPALLGGTFLWLAHKDYDRARDIRDQLALPSAGTGDGYSRKLAENHDAADRGDTRFYTGIGLLGVSALLATTGFVIVF